MMYIQSGYIVCIPDIYYQGRAGPWAHTSWLPSAPEWPVYSPRNIGHDPAVSQLTHKTVLTYTYVPESFTNLVRLELGVPMILPVVPKKILLMF